MDGPVGLVEHQPVGPAAQDGDGARARHLGDLDVALLAGTNRLDLAGRPELLGGKVVDVRDGRAPDGPRDELNVRPLHVGHLLQNKGG